jgi:hypothetical protein
MAEGHIAVFHECLRLDWSNSTYVEIGLAFCPLMNFRSKVVPPGIMVYCLLLIRRLGIVAPPLPGLVQNLANLCQWMAGDGQFGDYLASQYLCVRCDWRV